MLIGRRKGIRRPRIGKRNVVVQKDVASRVYMKTVVAKENWYQLMINCGFPHYRRLAAQLALAALKERKMEHGVV